MARFWCEYLAEKLKELGPEADEEMEPDEKEKAQEVLEFVERITAYLVGHLEGFSDATAARIESLFRDAGAPLDKEIEHYYVRDMLTRVPKIVARTMKLSHIIPNKGVSGPTEIYLKEATRAYLFGFWDASVALSRTAVEQGLRQAVEERLRQNLEKLRDLVDTSLYCGLLDRPRKDLADKVVNSGNRVLHSKPADETEAWDVLCTTRGVLLHLVSPH
jgi:HEPN domain-containing protein